MRLATSVKRLAAVCDSGAETAALRIHVRSGSSRVQQTSAAGAAPRVRRASEVQRREFHLSAQRRAFDRDVLLGVSGNFFGPIPGEAVARYDAAEMGRATDYPVANALLALAPDTRQRVRADFAAAATRLHESKGGPPPSAQVVEAMMHEPTLDAFGFTRTTRASVVEGNPTYLSSYWQPAVRTALHRGGTITLHPGNFCFHRYFRNITSIATAAAGDPGERIAAFFEQALVSDLHERVGALRSKPRASVTDAELFDVLEGVSSAAISAADSDHQAAGSSGRRAQPGLEVLTSDGARSIDTRQFRSLYQRACEASRSPENFRCLIDTGRFTAQAGSAVKALQALVHGTPDSLPDVVEWQFDLHVVPRGQTNV